MDYSKEDNNKKKRKLKSKSKKVKNKFMLIFFRIFIAIFLISGFAGAGALIGAYLGIIQNAPNFTQIEVLPDIFTSIVYEDSTGKEIDRFKAEENREYVKLDNISPYLRDAFVAIEDERFYSHNGVDFRAMGRIAYLLIVKHEKQGASTITQQLIKNNVTKVLRNDIESKLQEQYLAVKYEEALLEKLGNKRDVKNYILELYLNTIGLHHGLNGVKTAAAYYFDKDVADLTLAESASIAAITQRPKDLAPDTNPENNKKRQLLVLDNMLRLNFISKAEYDNAVAENVYDKITANSTIAKETTSYHSYFVDQLFSDIQEDLMNKKGYSKVEATNMIYNKGLKIYATIDTKMQEIVDEAFLNDELFPAKDFSIDVNYFISIKNSVTGKTRHLEKNTTIKKEEDIQPFIESVKNEELGANDTYTDRYEAIPQPQAGMVIMDYYTGQVKAIGGGRGEKTSNRTFNRATNAVRSPGSVFKVLASYAPAIDMGLISPSTVIDDVPYVYKVNGKPWSPKNWYNSYKGLVNVRQGITNSINTVTVKNMETTGIDNCFNYLLNFGFEHLVDKPDANGNSDRGLSTAIGGLTNGVTQLEIAAAYGAIANQGNYTKPIFYTKVLDHNGEVLLDNTPETKQVLKKTTAYLLTDMMQGVFKDPGATGTAAKFKNVKMPLAGKTGTTSDTKDLNFVGYTPYYVGSVWLGFDQQKKITQSGYNLKLWSYVMEKIHEGLPYKEFEKPDGLVEASVCKYSGKLAVSGLCDHDPRGSSIIKSLFVAGTVPTESCDVHVKVEIDTSTGMLANPYCPEEFREEKIGILRPDAQFEGKAGDSKYEISRALLDGPVCNVHNPFSTPAPVEMPVYDNPSDEISGSESPLPTDPYDWIKPPDYNNTPSLIPTPTSAPVVPEYTQEPTQTYPPLIPGITPKPQETVLPIIE